MQEDIFDNKYILASDKAVNLVKIFFKERLPLYSPIKEYITSTGQWGVGFAYTDNNILISSDRGYLDTEITLNDKPVSMLEYEPMMEEAKVSSEKNIQFVLNKVKELLLNQQE